MIVPLILSCNRSPQALRQIAALEPIRIEIVDGIFGNIFLGVVGGVLASWLFWRYLLGIKPRIEVSPWISCIKVSATGQNRYRIKIVNRGKNQVIGISVNAWVVYLQPVPGGEISHALYSFTTHKSETLALNPASKSDRPWGLTPETTIILGTDKDLVAELTDTKKRLMVTLRYSDAISGTTVVTQQTFDSSALIDGLFRFGTSLEIEKKL